MISSNSVFHFLIIRLNAKGQLLHWRRLKPRELWQFMPAEVLPLSKCFKLSTKETKISHSMKHWEQRMNSGDQRDLGNEMRSILLAHFFPLVYFWNLKNSPRFVFYRPAFCSATSTEQPPIPHRAGELWQANVQNAELETINIFYCWGTAEPGAGAVCFL